MIIIIVSVIFVFSNNAESSEINEIIETYPFTIENSDGSTTIIENEPLRVVSVSPTLTEMMYAIGAGDKLVGRSEYCDYPSDVLQVPSVGDIYPINVDNILRLEPEVVLTSNSFSDEEMSKFETAGVRVIVLFEERELSGVYSMISELGKSMNKNSESQLLIEQMKSLVDTIAEKTIGIDKPSVYYVVGYGEFGDYTGGGDTFVQSILNAAGAKNIAEHVSGWNYSIETLIDKNPDYIIVPDYAYEDFIKMEPYASLSAVKEGRVISIDRDLISRQGARNAEAIRIIAEAIYKEVEF